MGLRIEPAQFVRGDWVVCLDSSSKHYNKAGRVLKVENCNYLRYVCSFTDEVGNYNANELQLATLVQLVTHFGGKI